MLSNQQTAVDHNMLELTKALMFTTPVFLDYLVSKDTLSDEERAIVEGQVTNAKKLRHLFHMLKVKDFGWPELLNYLRKYNHSILADKIQNDADENSGDSGEKILKRSALEEFSLRLAQYYKLNYTSVPTMGVSAKHVKDVWVPLQIDGRSEDHLPADRINHIELLSRLRSAQDCNVALVRGDPGMGKTILSKKIAYDWAINCDSASTQQFNLVLAVPLRYAKKSNRFDQLAIDYFFSIIDMEGVDKSQLTSDICQLKSQLLVILDGLDEYGSYGESPFRLMFEAPFQHSSVNCREQPHIVSFKMIITSRPYACERVNDEFWPLRYTILPLDANHLKDFAVLYCQTQNGIAKVIDYLKFNAKLVVQVPLLLTFVCFLADSMQEIPTNMTSLYDNLIRQMIRREIRQGKLAEPVDIQKWKQSNVVTTTAELAFRGKNDGRCNNFEFSSDTLNKCNVNSDSFICGFLLHKFDFASGCVKAEFPHRSIQEFFAALHCYQLMLTGCKDELGNIRDLIIMGDRQVGRFLFGISSLEGKFSEVAVWVRPSLGYSVDIWSFAEDINQFGKIVLDCSSHDITVVAQLLQQSIGHLEERINDNRLIRDDILNWCSISDDFKKALHPVDLSGTSRGDSRDWCVAVNRQSAQLAVVSVGLPELLKVRFDHINILIWTVDLKSGMDCKSFFSQIRSFPPVRTLILSTVKKKLYQFADTSVVVRIGYDRMARSDLINFRFDYDREQTENLLEAVLREKLVKLTENKREKPILLAARSVIHVTASGSLCQSDLIASLIRLSFVDTCQSVKSSTTGTTTFRRRTEGAVRSRRCVIG